MSNKRNQAEESRLLNNSEIEQRAMQIARDEGRGIPSADDRARASEELLAPNEEVADPEVTPELGEQIQAWDEAPGESGTKTPDIIPEDNQSVGKDLVEKGMRGPTKNSLADDQRRK